MWPSFLRRLETPFGIADIVYYVKAVLGGPGISQKLRLFDENGRLLALRNPGQCPCLNSVSFFQWRCLLFSCSFSSGWPPLKSLHQRLAGRLTRSEFRTAETLLWVALRQVAVGVGNLDVPALPSQKRIFPPVRNSNSHIPGVVGPQLEISLKPSKHWACAASALRRQK